LPKVTTLLMCWLLCLDCTCEKITLQDT
jgi:hypothetical protein